MKKLIIIRYLGAMWLNRPDPKTPDYRVDVGHRNMIKCNRINIYTNITIYLLYVHIQRIFLTNNTGLI